MTSCLNEAISLHGDLHLQRVQQSQDLHGIGETDLGGPLTTPGVTRNEGVPGSDPGVGLFGGPAQAVQPGSP